jgi:hypothetical protein
MMVETPHSGAITLPERMIRLLIKSGADCGLSLELKPGRNHLGRTANNELVIEDETVSSRHCEIVVEQNTITVRDLNSTNGTFVAGKRITESRIEDGQALKVGDIEMTLEKSADIAIPKVNFEEKMDSVVLADGSMACLKHSTVKAAFRCTQCKKFFCATCVSKLRLSGGNLNIFCPKCSGPCELLESARPQAKKSFFARLRESLKVTRKT